MKIVVLAGGLSTERDVSLTSGAGIWGPNMRVGTNSEICPITVHFNN